MKGLQENHNIWTQEWWKVDLKQKSIKAHMRGMEEKRKKAALEDPR